MFKDSFDAHTSPRSFEECFYQLRKEMTEIDQKTFKGYEFLEFLSPGWLRNKIKSRHHDEELLKYYTQLEAGRNHNKKERKAQSESIGRKLLQDFTNCNKMAQSLKMKSEEERALIVCE